MKKRTLAILFATIMSIGVMSGCAASSSKETTAEAEKETTTEEATTEETASEETASTEETTAADDPYAAATELTGGVLRVGMECAYAPFNWTQSTAAVDADGWEAVPIFGTSDYGFGYDIMFAQKIADEMGWKLEVHKIEWSSIVLGMQSGDYDCIIAGMVYTEERDKTVDFTRAYYNRDNVMVVAADGPYANATGLSDFDGCSAVTQINTSWADYVTQIPNVKAGTFPETTSEVIMQVATGAADCAVLDYPTAYSAALSNPAVKVIKLTDDNDFITPEGMSEAVSVAVDEGNTVLKDAIEAAMDAIGWDQADMDEYMDLGIEVQPLSN